MKYVLFFWQCRLGSGSSAVEISGQKNRSKLRPTEWWFDEDGLFNRDDEGRAEKQQSAVAASNIIRNFSFMLENEIAMAQHRHCLETVFQCLEDHIVGETTPPIFSLIMYSLVYVYYRSRLKSFRFITWLAYCSDSDIKQRKIIAFLEWS